MSVQVLELEDSRNTYLSFHVGDELMAAKILSVREVIEPFEIYPIANTINCFRGIINVRGEVIGVLDLRMKFGVTAEDHKEMRYLVHESDQGPVAFIVDKVVSVVEIKDEKIDLNVRIRNAQKMDYFKGIARVNEQLMTVVELNSIFDSDGMLEIQKSVKQNAS